MCQHNAFEEMVPTNSPEEWIHDLCAALLDARRHDEAILALVETARRIASARAVRWVENQEAVAPPVEGERELFVQAGDDVRGRLIFEPGPGGSLTWTVATLRRLRTVCSMAALALIRLGRKEYQADRVENHRWETVEHATPMPTPNDEEVENSYAAALARNNFVAPALQDATFLNAVLPFAMGQARRHREPLSLLCVAIDRLNAIRHLLGDCLADRTVRNVGRHIATLLRTSDIVARIDDDRIIVVLPRADIKDARRLAQKICQSVSGATWLFPELSELTLSIGVVETPGTADNPHALMEAADSALSQARSQRRSRAESAFCLGAPAMLEMASS